MSVEKTLKERGENYGDYSGGSRLRADIMIEIKARYLEVNEEEMSEHHAGKILDIVNKLSRLAATPDHIDSWHDIVGYATLSEEYYIHELYN